MSVHTINTIDTELFRCAFCGALCDEQTVGYGCMNHPIHKLNVRCDHVLKTLADPMCSECEGTGLAYRFEDRDCIEGYKMASKKVCACVAAKVAA